MRKVSFLLFLLLLLSVPASCQVKVAVGFYLGGAYPKYGVSVNFRVNEKVTLEPIFSFGLNQNRGDLRWGLRCKYNLSPQSSRDCYLGLGIGAAQSRNMWETKQELGFNAFVGIASPGTHFTSSFDLGPEIARVRYLPHDELETEEFFTGGMRFGFGYHYNFHKEP